MVVPFKTRVKLILEECALDYLHNFVGKRYIIYSSHFTNSIYYTIEAKKDNYLHLTGVITKLKAEVFFDKCVARTLQESDFELGDKSRKGSIRKKIQVLKRGVNLFDGTYLLYVEERLIKNKVVCSFATSDGTCTLGFILKRNAKPLTLLRGNELTRSHPVELIIKTERIKNTSFSILVNINNLSITEIRELLLSEI